MGTTVSGYQRTYRRMLLDMHIPDWHPDLMTEYEPETLAELYSVNNVSGVLFSCKSCMGLNYWPAPVGGIHPAAKDRDLVGEMLAALRARGIAPAAYHSVIFDNWAVEHHPEWAVVPARTLKGWDPHVVGTQLLGVRWGAACANNPAYRAYENLHIKALLERYDFDTLWIDMVLWADLCVCTNCRDRFRAEEGADIPMVVDWESPVWARFQAARERWLEEMTIELIETAEQTRPGIAVTHNLAGGTLGWLIGEKLQWGRYDTFAAGDLYGGGDEQLFMSRAWIHLGKEQPAEFMTSRCMSIQTHTALKSEHRMLVEALATMANGCAFTLIDAIDPRGTVNAGVYEQIGRVFKETARYEAFLGGTPVEDVGIYYSDESRVLPGDNGRSVAEVMSRPKDYPHLRAVMGAGRRLQAAHIPFGVMTRNDLERLMDYRVVVLADVIRMDEEEVQALRSYVEGGGCVYASGRTSLLGTNGVRRDDFGMADVFGGHIADTEKGSGIYLRARTAALLEAMRPEAYFSFGFPAAADSRGAGATLDMPRLETSYQGEALATLNVPYGYPSPGSRDGRDFASLHSSPPWRDLDNPTIIAHRFGRGKSIYSVVPIETDETDIGGRVFSTLMSRLLGGTETLTTDASPEVWLTAFDQSEHERVVISVLCYRTDVRPRPFPLKFRYRLGTQKSCRAVRVALSGAELPFSVNVDRDVTVTIPSVDLFDMYVLEYERKG